MMLLGHVPDNIGVWRRKSSGLRCEIRVLALLPVPPSIISDIMSQTVGKVCIGHIVLFDGTQPAIA
jgi:hypothetical protein